MAKLLSVNVIPAQPGYYPVYEIDDLYDVDMHEPVLAWRIETYRGCKDGEVSSIVNPLTVAGDVDKDCIGVQSPNLSVLVFGEDGVYVSLDALVESRSGEEG